MTPPLYLKTRKGIWYVQVPVPKARQKAVGAFVLERSLRTRDEAEAMRLRFAVIAEFQALIHGATDAPPPDPAEAVLALAHDLREAVDSGALDEHDAEASLDAAVDKVLADAARKTGIDEEGHPRLPAEAVSTIRRAHKALSGDLTATLAFQREAYLQEAKTRLTAQTIDDKTKRLAAFGKWFGDDRACAEVTRKAAGRYVAEKIVLRRQKRTGAPSVSPVTMKKEISDLRSWFDWLLVRGVIDTNPFDRMSSTVRGSTRGKEPPRRPWYPTELETVLGSIDANDAMWSMAAIGAYTGMRREEIGGLRAEDVQGEVLVVRLGKSPSAQRRVPIHPAIAPLIKRLAETTSDGYLIPGLLRGGPDKKRGWYLGKRFGYTIRKLGVTDRKVVLHGFRNSVMTQLEDAGVPTSTVQLIVGHKRTGMTLGVYSAGVSDKVKREALLKVTYGDALDSFVARAGAEVRVKPSAKARNRPPK